MMSLRILSTQQKVTTEGTIRLYKYGGNHRLKFPINAKKRNIPGIAE